jgi:uncharacterized protein (TIGR03790 family)
MTRNLMIGLAVWVVLLGCMIFGGRAHAGIAPTRAEDLMLVVNRLQPEGRKLAEYYASVRGVPASNIIEIEVADRFSVDRSTFERSIRDAIRESIRASEGMERTRGLVLFYGVPLRVDAGPVDADVAAEYAAIQSMYNQVHPQAVQGVQSLETLAVRLDPTFRPRDNTNPDVLNERVRLALDSLNTSIAKVPEAQREGRKAEYARARQLIEGPATVRELGPVQVPATPPTQEQINQLAREQSTADGRSKLRQIVHATGGKLGLLNVLAMQRTLLGPDHTDASVDSELALLWHDSFPRKNWQANPFYLNDSTVTPEQAIKIARLDGPDPATVRRMIDDALRIENEGLRGTIVIDARGLKPEGGLGSFGWYDQSLRNLATLLKNANVGPILFDDSEPTLPIDSATDASIYCGWYAVRSYRPSVRSVPGAVAFHVASFELNWMRDPADAGWCRGLLLDGAAATLGPVAEPFLIAFPSADEFFPLLLSGRIPLIDTYWATMKMTSWKMTLLGDPLYIPYRTNPLLKPDQLPEGLRGLLD